MPVTGETASPACVLDRTAAEMPCRSRWSRAAKSGSEQATRSGAGLASSRSALPVGERQLDRARERAAGVLHLETAPPTVGHVLEHGRELPSARLGVDVDVDDPQLAVR